MAKWWPGASTQVVHNKIMSSAAVCYASGCLSRVWGVWHGYGRYWSTYTALSMLRVPGADQNSTPDRG